MFFMTIVAEDAPGVTDNTTGWPLVQVPYPTDATTLDEAVIKVFVNVKVYVVPVALPRASVVTTPDCLLHVAAPARAVAVPLSKFTVPPLPITTLAKVPVPALDTFQVPPVPLMSLLVPPDTLNVKPVLVPEPVNVIAMPLRAPVPTVSLNANTSPDT